MAKWKIETCNYFELIEQGGACSRLVQEQDLGETSGSTDDLSDGEKAEAVINVDEEMTRILTTASIRADVRKAGSKYSLPQMRKK